MIHMIGAQKDLSDAPGGNGGVTGMCENGGGFFFVFLFCFVGWKAYNNLSSSRRWLQALNEKKEEKKYKKKGTRKGYIYINNYNKIMIVMLL